MPSPGSDACLDKCVGNGVNTTMPDPNQLACTETYRFLRNVYNQGIADAWSTLAAYETQALELADAEEVNFLKAFQAQQNVEYYDMIKMDGLEGDAVATATYDILKAYIISSEHSVGGKDNAYSKVRYANSGKYPDHREQLVPFLAARIQDLEKKMQDVPVRQPWINGNSTFKKPKMPVVDGSKVLPRKRFRISDVTKRLNCTGELT